MFLNQLNATEKNNFLDLAICIIKADGVIAESETLYLNEYLKELSIQSYDIQKEIDFGAIAKEIGQNSSKQVQKIVLLELVACALSDGHIADEEKTLLQILIDECKFSEKDFEECTKLLSEYNDITKKILLFISEED